jgi:hypothetical protein
MDWQELMEWAKGRDRIFLLDVESELGRLGDEQWIPPDPQFSLGDDVLDLTETWSSLWRDEIGFRGPERRSVEEFVRQAIAEAWGVTDEELEAWEVESEDLISVVDAEPVLCCANELSKPQQLGLEPGQPAN